MAHGYESLLGAAWLTQTLTGDSELASLAGTSLAGMAGRVWDGTAPKNTPTPFCVFNEQSPGRDTQGVNATIILNKMMFLVRWVADGTDYLALAPLAARTHALLHQQGGAVIVSSGGTAILSGRVTTARSSPFRQDFTDADGHPKRSLGGIYDLYIEG